jgi:uncharacterized membrane protein
VQKTKALVKKLLRHIWVSYWLIPALISFALFLMASATLFVDQNWAGEFHSEFILLAPTQPASAQSLLSTIAGSVVGVAGVVFYITMVAVSFASGNFGPRLIGNFMRDRGNQVSLGIFIGTFIYTLMVLRTVKGSDSQSFDASSIAEFVQQFSIAISLGLAIVCMGTLIYFIHHVPETINIERIISQLGRSLQSGIRDRFPIGVLKSISSPACCEPWTEENCDRMATEIQFRSEVYVQEIDLKSLHLLAKKNDLLIKVLNRPGGFVTNMTCMMRIWYTTEHSDDLREELANCTTVDAEQTIAQNVEFVVDQLVEIIARALSPGMNDPFTAVACLNWLQVGILQFAHDEEAKFGLKDHRVHVEPLTFESFVESIFAKSIPYISTDVNVVRSTRDILNFLIARVPEAHQKRVLKCHLSDLIQRSKNLSD